jgi:hypothetical protein
LLSKGEEIMHFGMRPLTQKILAEIDAVVDLAKRSRTIVQIYAEAENIRRANFTANIALEDIVDALLLRMLR